MRKKLSGIYSIICLINGKYYVGSSVNIYNRKSNHFSELRKNKHGNPHLQYTYNLYGKDAFVFTLIEEHPEIGLLDYEQTYLDVAEKEQQHTFNICFIAGGGPAMCGEKNHNYGKPMSEETKRKLSEATKGEKCVWFGRKHTEETKTKMREKRKLRSMSHIKKSVKQLDDIPY